MDPATQKKWDRAARGYDLMNGYGPEWRWGPYKRWLFSTMAGRVLFVAIGTGQDIQFFPAGQEITAIDISPRMIEHARVRADGYDGRLELRQLDVHDLDYPDATFDKVFTSCTFCSVADPVNALKELRRVLCPGGTIGMFEHTGSRFLPFSLMLDLMTPLMRQVGPELNRDTLANLYQAGFVDVNVELVYLDVVKLIHGVAPCAGGLLEPKG